MKNHNSKSISIPQEIIQQKIYLIRHQKVMLSSDLASLYQVQPKVLVQAVKRNIERFPSDFMFQLDGEEFENLKSQFVTSSWGGLRRAAPYAFTEQGVAMLSSVLHSKKAVQVNIAIMRAFVQLREILSTHKDLVLRIDKLEFQSEKQEDKIHSIFDLISQMQTQNKKSLGFKTSDN